MRPVANTTGQVSVRITQRHSWRLSAHPCNDTSATSNITIGEGLLVAVSSNRTNVSNIGFPSINAQVKCTDFSAEFDYSSGETAVTVVLPANARIEYRYYGCCWIPLLMPDSESDWSLPLVINTYRRPDGR